ncbi:MAG: hypothetical protein J6Y94_03280 [Bacteriovoracaceae bacterium]|nr:hypothetical protein [Bacteriovoracaceae bacterium]
MVQRALQLCFFLILLSSGFGRLSWAAPSSCPKLLAQDLLPQGLAAVADQPTAFLPLEKIDQHDWQVTPIDYEGGFFVHEYSPWSVMASYTLCREGAGRPGRPWQVSYFDEEKRLHGALWFIFPEWEEHDLFFKNLSKAWQSFPPIYLSKLKTWNFPSAPFKQNPQVYLNKRHDVTFGRQGVVVEWRKFITTAPRQPVAYLRPPARQVPTIKYWRTAIAQALAVAWAATLKEDPHFMAAWRAAALQDQASEEFSPEVVAPFILQSPLTSSAQRGKVLAAAIFAATRLAQNHNLPDQPLIFRHSDNIPLANFGQVLQVRVTVQEDPAAQAEKEFVRTHPQLDLQPESSLFWGRNLGQGKLYRVTRFYGQEQVSFKILIEDYTAHPVIERQAIQQIKWMTAIVPGRFWQPISTVQILPPQLGFDYVTWFSFSKRPYVPSIDGIARLKLTSSITHPGMKDLLLFFEEGFRPLMINPGLGQMLCFDLYDWFTRSDFVRR